MDFSIKPLPMKEHSALTIPHIDWINDRRENPKWFTAASLFAGCGSASTGVKLAGGSLLYASEFIPGAARSYAANAPYTHLDVRDIRDVSGREILDIMRLRRGELDYLDSSPPCKAYSAASRHNKIGQVADRTVLYSEGVDQRVDDLFDEHVRVMTELMPKVAVIENVMGLAQSVNIGTFHEICAKMKKPGYALEVRAIDPTKLGVPQTRTRLVFMAIRKDLYAQGLRHVWPTHYKSTHVLTVKDGIPEAAFISAGKGQWRDARTPSPTLTVTAGKGDEFSGLSAAPFYRDVRGRVLQYSIPEMKYLFGMPPGFRLGGDAMQRYERLARAHTPLAVYNICGNMMRALRAHLVKTGTRSQPIPRVVANQNDWNELALMHVAKKKSNHEALRAAEAVPDRERMRDMVDDHAARKNARRRASRA